MKYIFLLFGLFLSWVSGGTSVEPSTMEYPFLGVSYKIDNPPYAPVTLVPYIEPDNAPEGTTVESNVVIADNNSGRKARKLDDLFLI
jgi:hypothetical protein